MRSLSYFTQGFNNNPRFYTTSLAVSYTPCHKCPKLGIARDHRVLNSDGSDLQPYQRETAPCTLSPTRQVASSRDLYAPSCCFACVRFHIAGSSLISLSHFASPIATAVLLWRRMLQTVVHFPRPLRGHLLRATTPIIAAPDTKILLFYYVEGLENKEGISHQRSLAVLYRI